MTRLFCMIFLEKVDLFTEDSFFTLSVDIPLLHPMWAWETSVPNCGKRTDFSSKVKKVRCLSESEVCLMYVYRLLLPHFRNGSANTEFGTTFLLIVLRFFIRFDQWRLDPEKNFIYICVPDKNLVHGSAVIVMHFNIYPVSRV